MENEIAKQEHMMFVIEVWPMMPMSSTIEQSQFLCIRMDELGYTEYTMYLNTKVQISTIPLNQHCL